MSASLLSEVKVRRVARHLAWTLHGMDHPCQKDEAARLAILPVIPQHNAMQ